MSTYDSAICLCLCDSACAAVQWSGCGVIADSRAAGCPLASGGGPGCAPQSRPKYDPSIGVHRASILERNRSLKRHYEARAPCAAGRMLNRQVPCVSHGEDNIFARKCSYKPSAPSILPSERSKVPKGRFPSLRAISSTRQSEKSGAERRRNRPSAASTTSASWTASVA